MLSGRVPFHSSSNRGRADAIIQKIKEGKFTFSGPEWDVVSPQAKQVISGIVFGICFRIGFFCFRGCKLLSFFFFQGLLTVDPSKRLKIEDLCVNEWIQGQNKLVYSLTPLMTPDVLSHAVSPRSTEYGCRAALDAFNLAAKEGFRLQVSQPMVQSES